MWWCWGMLTVPMELDLRLRIWLSGSTPSTLTVILCAGRPGKRTALACTNRKASRLSWTRHCVHHGPSLRTAQRAMPRHAKTSWGSATMAIVKSVTGAVSLRSTKLRWMTVNIAKLP